MGNCCKKKHQNPDGISDTENLMDKSLKESKRVNET